MQKLHFKNLEFEIIDGKIFLTSFGNVKKVFPEMLEKYNFCEAQISGENKDTHMGVKMINSSEGAKFKLVDYLVKDDTLIVTLCSGILEAKVNFVCYQDTQTVRIFTEYKNVSENDIVLEEASAFCVTGIGNIYQSENLKFTRFFQSHHAECQPKTYTFKDLGLFRGTGEGQKVISHANVGSWSTKEELPQGIIENSDGKFIFFQIESNNSWYYEISDKYCMYYLYLGGANSTYGGWSKKLGVGETYRTVNVAVSFGDSLDSVVGEMTKYRRIIRGRCRADENLPTIFNEYMHLSWDSPSEENTKKYAPTVQKTGVKYYVIDCGWHDEVDTDIIYHYVGKWRESKRRFPSGIKATCDYIRSLGLKPGLWIEPEVVGFKNEEMINYYGDECFIKRNGKKVTVMNRLFLDYRQPKVREYMTETIRVMVEDYGAEYIKMDYNQDLGIGTETDAYSFGEGLEKSALAFAEWIEEIVKKFPQVVFEGCSSGGMRMDYKTLSLYSLVSTSDQVDCYKYPYIAGNILSAVTPEQAAVWSYPVGEIGGAFLTNVTKEWVDKNINSDRVALNMINSFLGRMHLASHLELLEEKDFELVKEGVSYYEKLTEAKKKGLPVFPNGFTGFEEKEVVAGIKSGNTIYLVVYNLGGELKKEIDLVSSIASVKVGYPISSPVKTCFENSLLKVEFTAQYQAVFLEIEV